MEWKSIQKDTVDLLLKKIETCAVSRESVSLYLHLSNSSLINETFVVKTISSLSSTSNHYMYPSYDSESLNNPFNFDYGCVKELLIDLKNKNFKLQKIESPIFVEPLNYELIESRFKLEKFNQVDFCFTSSKGNSFIGVDCGSCYFYIKRVNGDTTVTIALNMLHVSRLFFVECEWSENFQEWKGAGAPATKMIESYIKRVRSGSIVTHCQQIPNYCNFEDFFKQIASLLPSNSTILEIGSFLGHSTALLATELKKRGKVVTYYVVDPWKAEYFDENDIRVALGESGSYLDVVEKGLSDLGVLDCVKLIPCTSAEASIILSETSFDFIFVDGNHTYEGVKLDIQTWYPKLKVGGLIAGDDILFDSVRRAVRDTIGEFEERKCQNGYACWTRVRLNSS